MTIQENVALGPMTTFKIGGNARFFCRAKNIADMKGALQLARERHIEVFVLGGGSNILVSDSGFSGLVIKNEIAGVEEISETKGKIIVRVGAGENWDIFVARAVRNGWHGIENLSLIPGTVGAAPVQNIGAYGVEVKSAIHSVEALHTETLVTKTFSTAECTFGYRDSFFKTAEGKKYVITYVNFVLTRTCDLFLSYKDIAQFYKDNPRHPQTLSGMRDAVIAIRTAKLPNLDEYGTAGSFFKNPVIKRSAYEILKKTYPEMPGFPAGDTMKVSLAWILDKVCGFKGAQRGSVGVYKNQALVIVNTGGATAEDVKVLADEMAVLVKEKTGISIEPEVQFVK